MIYVNKIDDKNFTVQNGENAPMQRFRANYEARSKDGVVMLNPQSARAGQCFKASFDAWKINGAVPTSAEDAQIKLNEFVNFKSGGGTPSPTPVDLSIDKITTLTPAAGAVTCDLSLTDSRIYKFAPSGATTVAVAGTTIPANSLKTFEVHVVQPAAAVAITWFGGISWLDGSAPTLAAGKTSVLVFRTLNGAAFVGNLAYSY